jgi:hypothetical protein
MSSETNLQLFPGVFRSTVGGENPGFFLHSDGRVGIGNKAPTARPTWDTDPNSTEKNKLNVSGHTHIEGNLNVTGHLYGDGSTLSGVAAVIGGYWDLDQSNNNIKYEAGNVGIGGAASGTNKLKVHGTVEVAGFVGSSGTGALTVPSGTTAEQPTGVTGMIRFNSTLSRLELYNGTAWRGVGGISATGGTVTTSDGYKIHTFTSGGTFTVISGGEVDYLAVAGGGGGGNGGPSSHETGGGGAGGLLSGNIPSLSAGNYLVVVGGGGGPATKGTNSSINFPTLITAEGGGQGATGGNASGGNGGSGGGGYHDSAGGNGTTGQGNNGGGGAVYLGINSTFSNSGGGGGGAGAPGGGVYGVTYGGDGIKFDYYNHKGSPAGWFAGGGRGAVHVNGRVNGSNGTSWASSLKGGGGSPNFVNGSGGPSNGAINTGGGGGASYTSVTGSPNGAYGGSGIVIIRYLL